jgi:EpsI family protein
MNGRALALAVLISLGGIWRLQLGAVELKTTGDLNQVPLMLETWSGQRAPDLTADVLATLMPDSYINRLYSRGSTIASLYVGYHSSQTYGRAIHSPMNCLPGAGWQPIRTEPLPFDDRGVAKLVVIEKAGERQLVMYWYQSSKRIEGDENLSKFHMVVDAFTTRRTDAALVRIVLPLARGKGDDLTDATNEALTLARLVEPHVRRLLFQTT